MACDRPVPIDPLLGVTVHFWHAPDVIPLHVNNWLVDERGGASRKQALTGDTISESDSVHSEGMHQCIYLLFIHSFVK